MKISYKFCTIGKQWNRLTRITSFWGASMFIHSLFWPIRKPLEILNTWANPIKISFKSRDTNWIGGEGIPGNTTHISRWRFQGGWAQWILPPYKTRSLFILAFLIGVSGISLELQTSWFQAKFLHYLASHLTYKLEAGPASSMVIPTKGPLDERRGYTRLPDFLQILEAHGFGIQSQAQASPELMKLVSAGFPPVYQEKAQSGLQILDFRNVPVYQAITPDRVFANFDAIPPLLVKSLLFIENRELLDPCCPYANPAMEWDRFGQALLAQSLLVGQEDSRAPGASTLATQMEKFQHSPGGQTTSVWEKARQVVTASLRIYQEDERTLDAQKQIILRYINSFPLGGYPGVGEIHGFGDGLWTWYGMDVGTLQTHLAHSTSTDPALLAQAGLSFKQGLSLLLALRRPAYYLQDIHALNEKTNLYLRLLSDAGVLSQALRDIGLHTPLVYTPSTKPSIRQVTEADLKATHFIRTQLQQLLKVPSLYDLDHLDVSMHTTLDQALQAKIGTLLQQLADSTFIEQTGLAKPHLLSHGNPANIIYSMTMYERTSAGNLLRVQTDTLNQPFDMNHGSKTDLGSTAKLRTLVTYLEVIERLFDTFHTFPSEKLTHLEKETTDPLTHWVISYLNTSPKTNLQDILEAALERRYTASPHERFWTGGGVHTFANFNKADNTHIFSVREAFHQSVNLVFIRLMRDLVQYYTSILPEAPSRILADAQHPIREQLLQQFIQQEGRQFLQQYYEIYQGRSPDASLHRLMNKGHRTSSSVGIILRSVYPDIDAKEFSRQFLQWQPSFAHQPVKVHTLFQNLNPDDWRLDDQGYLANVHPLELLTVQFLAEHPQDTKRELFQAAASRLGEVYAWLFSAHRKSAQDQRIHIMLEQKAFHLIHRDWQRQGYPFSSLVPSLATAIGSSADRPSALAQLMGILANDGQAMPDIILQQIHFAKNTPFETMLTPQPATGTQVVHPVIAKLVKRELIDVVNKGTARLLKDIFKNDSPHPLAIGGKTGTGDHRQKRYDAGLRLIQSKPISRTATFVFLIENRFYGTITAQVLGPESGEYDFTSSLPVTIFRLLAPYLKTSYFVPSSVLPST